MLNKYRVVGGVTAIWSIDLVADNGESGDTLIFSNEEGDIVAEFNEWNYYLLVAENVTPDGIPII